MSLLKGIRSEFLPGVRQRGEAYYRSGAVRIKSVDDGLIKAAVQGTQRYTVTLEQEGDEIYYDCSCPYAESHVDPCKHIWATLMAADDQGLLTAVEEDAPPIPPHRNSLPKPAPPKPPEWEQNLKKLRRSLEQSTQMAPPPPSPWPANRRLVYVVDIESTLNGNLGLVIDLGAQTLKNGQWGPPKQLRSSRGELLQIPDPADRQIVQILLGARAYSSYYYDSYDSSSRFQFTLNDRNAPELMEMICRTGRCRVRRMAYSKELSELTWDEGPPWELLLQVGLSAGGKFYQVQGAIRRNDQRLSIGEPLIVLRCGLVIHESRMARFDHHGAFDLAVSLRSDWKLSVPVEQAGRMLAELFALPQLPPLDLPPELQVQDLRPVPRPRLLVKKPAKTGWYYYDDHLSGEVSFDYDGQIIPITQCAASVYRSEHRQLVHRDREAERAAEQRLLSAGFRKRQEYHNATPAYRLSPARLSKAVGQLTAEGWHVEAEGKLYRSAGEFRIDVRSGIDWFELHGDVQFGDQFAPLPKLLAAIRRGQNMVQLDDGTLGILPDEWLKKYGLLAGIGEDAKDHLRFTQRQAGLLDALLAAMPEARCDQVFQNVRQELHRFEGIQPADAPPGFVGELRQYQREGLGWFHFLQRFGFGGCLADDMGLGKTIQVLALLEERRALRAQSAPGTQDSALAPSLVVVPRSLVFNWIQEAARFTVNLRVLDHTGGTRRKSAEHFSNYDVVLTTYGLLRRDAHYFKDVAFDYLILDEAQAIKNASSESAKASRLLRGRHRLILSGTPVQNHLGELWSLFEFLNPGLLGSASVFRDLGGSASGKMDPETRAILARALRPFILRRTKSQVARDLPERTEQTIFCAMEAPQRKLYDELRSYYRDRLLQRISAEGINKAKIEILEALLRLRQAACHPGLIDATRQADASAELDVLLPQIEEVLDEGHKVLVFSQFTSFLSIVRRRLDDTKTPYEYLDGKTRDRQARVERFQNDPDCKLFLISLKAGGLGLNLTAAEYVYLLDPWWNPAVEAQAIDRAHRIGQTRQVFAYRLIARDTVEEKVLQLQQTKRELADAIINADNSLIGRLDAQDLQLLLS